MTDGQPNPSADTEAGTPAAQVDEENIRLVTSFNDIFVSIAITLVLVAAGTLGGALAVAVVCWGLAEFFTRRRRMALPSVLLATVFTAGIAFGLARLVGTSLWDSDLATGAITTAMWFAMIGLVTAAATGAYWVRFKVPVSIACGTLAVALSVLGLVVAAISQIAGREAVGVMLPWLSIGAGVAIFAWAMRWDMSDLARVTRRSDVAFWLHLAASPLIVHPLFLKLGTGASGDHATRAAVLAVLAYVALGVVAVVVDRRALLVSALAYVLIAMGVLLRVSSNGAGQVALPAAVIGGLLLLLSAFWKPMRQRAIALLPPAIQARLPVVA